MNRHSAMGAALSAVGLTGYVVGVGVAYPGRAVSVTAVMLGVALLALGGWRGSA